MKISPPWHWIGCSLACVLLAGCSLKLTYNYLDWWISWQVADYVTLDDQQQALLDDAAQGFLRWHRQSELPRYAELAADADLVLRQPVVTTEQLAAIEERAERLWLRSLDQLLPVAARLMAGLSDAQVKEIDEALRRSRDQFKADYIGIPEDERLAQRVESLSDNLQEVLGSLSGPQQQLVASAASRLQSSAAMVLAHRAQEHQQFLAMLERRRDLHQFTAELTAFAHNYRLRRPPALQAAYDANARIIFQLLVEIHADLTPDQREFLSAYLRQHQELFLSLAASRS